MKRPKELAASILYMKREAGSSCERLAPLNQATLRHIMEDHNLDP